MYCREDESPRAYELCTNGDATCSMTKCGWKFVSRTRRSEKPAYKGNKPLSYGSTTMPKGIGFYFKIRLLKPF